MTAAVPPRQPGTQAAERRQLARPATVEVNPEHHVARPPLPAGTNDEAACVTPLFTKLRRRSWKRRRRRAGVSDTAALGRDESGVRTEEAGADRQEEAAADRPE